jgi:hypothetical protein
MSDDIDTTTLDEDTMAEIQSGIPMPNGHTRRRARQAGPTGDVLGELRAARAKALARVKSLRDELRGLEEELSRHTVPKDADVVVDARPSVVRDEEFRTLAKALGETKQPAPRRGRKSAADSRADSLPSRVLADLIDHPESRSADIALRLGAETPRISSALVALTKRGKVVSAGDRPSMTWSAT